MRTETQSTPDIVDVPTNSGFNAGDLVYLQNNKYQRLSGPTTASFPASVNSDNSIGIPGKNYVQQVFDNTVSPSYAKNGASVSKSSAVLTNGNIVHVIKNPQNNAPAFCIKDSTGADVVALTDISTTYTVNTPVVNVCALTGGNFAVSWIYSTSSLYFAIYDSTGTVVSSPTLAASMNSTYMNSMNCVSLPNGNFVLVYPESNGWASARVYGPTGSAISSQTVLQSFIADSAFPIVVTARSDSTFVVIWKRSGVNTYYWSACTAAGAVSTSGNFTNASSASTYCITAATKSDNTILIAYSYNNCTVGLRTLSAANALSSETALPTTNMFVQSGTPYASAISLLFLSNGNYILMFQDSGQATAYAFFDSNNVCLSGTNANGMIPKYIPGVYAIGNNLKHLHLIEYGNYVNLYFCPSRMSSSDIALFQNVVKINKTTFDLYVPNTVTNVIGNATLATGNYAESASNPTSAKFYAASTQTTTISQPIQISVGPVTSYYNSLASNLRSACSLTNGNFVLVEVDQSGSYPVYASIYDGTTGTKITSVTVDTATIPSRYPDVKPTANGGFVVAYAKTASSAVVSTYTSTGTQTDTFTISSNINSNASSTPIRICVTTSGAYGISYLDGSSYVYMTIRSPSGTSYLADNRISTIVQYQRHGIAAGPNDFVAVYDNSGSALYITTWVKTGVNTWTKLVDHSNVLGAEYHSSGLITVLPCGLIAISSGPNTSTYRLYLFYNGNSSIASGQYITYSDLTTSSTSNTNCGFCMTSNGSLFMYGNSGTARLMGLMGAISTTASTYPSANNTVPTGMTSSDIGTVFDIQPSIGNSILMFYQDPSSNEEAIIVNALPVATNYTYTAGVSTSQSIPVYQSNTSTSPAIQNTELAGVALTSASAGSTGKLITKGIATLNSNYPSTGSGAFDYQSYNKTGVKGTYSGRTVNLMGKD